MKIDTYTGRIHQRLMRLLIYRDGWATREKKTNQANFLLFLKLRYNSHTITFTLLKCTVQWTLVYSELCNQHDLQFQSTFISSKRNGIPIISHSLLLPPPAPSNH